MFLTLSKCQFSAHSVHMARVYCPTSMQKKIIWLLVLTLVSDNFAVLFYFLSTIVLF